MVCNIFRFSYILIIFSSSEPAPEDIRIFFNYTDGNNLYELPDDYVIENGTKGDLKYIIRAKTAGHTTILVNATPPIPK